MTNRTHCFTKITMSDQAGFRRIQQVSSSKMEKISLTIKLLPVLTQTTVSVSGHPWYSSNGIAIARVDQL